MSFLIDCGCNDKGTVDNGSRRCDKNTGRCICKSGYFGEKCYLGKFSMMGPNLGHLKYVIDS